MMRYSTAHVAGVSLACSGWCGRHCCARRAVCRACRMRDVGCEHLLRVLTHREWKAPPPRHEREAGAVGYAVDGADVLRQAGESLAQDEARSRTLGQGREVPEQPRLESRLRPLPPP